MIQFCALLWDLLVMKMEKKGICAFIKSCGIVLSELRVCFGGWSVTEKDRKDEALNSNET